MRKEKGFTLVELLVSISIIAILSVIMTVSYSSAQKSGRDQRRIADVKAIQSAAEQYYLLNGSYPTSYSAGSSWSIGTQMVLERYPADPKSTSSYSSGSSGATGYCVCATLEKTNGGNSSNTSCNFVANGAYFCVKNQQ
jgi:prepilin-type N-terminal cleavage/methylation domain-containing protein